MFTGLVVERGRILSSQRNSDSGGLRLRIAMSKDLAERLSLGASLAVSGCCLTIVERSLAPHGVWADVDLSRETLNRTTLGGLVPGDLVNLEPALVMGQPLGGHWVQGHVDGTTELVERVDDQDFSTFWWRVPEPLRNSFVEKGSVTVDGVSLTVAELQEGRFAVALIPHTLDQTTLGDLRVGDPSNLEVDILSKYVERTLAGRLEALEELQANLQERGQAIGS